MSLPVIANTWRVAFNYTLAGVQPASNIVHVFDEVGTKSPDQVAQSCGDNWANVIQTANFSDQVSFDDCVATKLDGLSAPTGLAQEVVGSNSAEMLPHQCAIVVTFKTALIGRRNRGRIYLPAGNKETPENADTSKVSDAFASGLAGDIAAWNEAIQLDSLHHVVASYVAATQHAVIDYIGRTSIYTQRRRVGN